MEGADDTDDTDDTNNTIPMEVLHQQEIDAG